MTTIKLRLVVLVLAPALVLTLFAGLWALGRFADYSASRDVAANVGLAARAGDFAHALQVERGTTTWRLRSGQFSDSSVRNLRNDSDAALASLRAAATYTQRREADAAALAAELERLRADVAGGVSATEVFSRYSALIAEVLATIDGAERRGDGVPGGVRAQLDAYVALAHGKELAGQERALGAAALATPRLQMEELARVAALQGAQDERFAAAVAASPSIELSWAAFVASPAHRDFVALRQRMMRSPGNRPAIAPEAWFAAATDRIEHLRQIEIGLTTATIADANAQERAAVWALFLAAVAALIGVIGVAVATLFTARWIVTPLQRLTDAMQALANGDLDVQIDDAGPGEVRALSGAVDVFRVSMRQNAMLTRDLQEAQRLSSLGAMVGGIAHEINTPIGNALMVASSFSEGVQALRAEVEAGAVRRTSIDRHLSSAVEAASLLELNLRRAADQIRSFKQMAVDQTSNLVRRFNLRSTIDDAVRSCTPTVKSARVVIEIEAPDDVVMISYPGALSQVLVNLIENAIKHGLQKQPNGSIRIVAQREGADEVLITFSDNGVGVPDEIAGGVFNAFFTTKAGEGGSGLGLHIVKSIVCGQLGGTVSLLPDQSAGAVFEIRIPLAAPATADAYEQSAKAA